MTTATATTRGPTRRTAIAGGVCAVCSGLLATQAPLAPLVQEAQAAPADNPAAATLDRRFGRPRNLNDLHRPSVPANPAAWAARRASLRNRVLLAAGLYPLPERTPLEPIVRDGADGGDYTVSRVHFQSLPGHHVTGSLYRPKLAAGQAEQPAAKVLRPGVLCPHGHWPNGRFYTNGEAGIKAELAAGRESDPIAAKSPLQARCAHLARMGCSVLLYDMVGYADSRAIQHRLAGNKPNELAGLEAARHGVSVFGLQTWNSIRALDFLLGLPEVDPARIAVTGSSGGGTQTFVLAAVDDRVSVAAPVVMVSTGMQGGCQCENAPHLRVGTDNIELAALFAPKPQIVVAATGDWTAKLLEDGGPQLRQIYALLGAEQRLELVRHTSPHNYNQLSRQSVYAFLAGHLLGESDPQRIKELATERPFTFLEPSTLSVWSDGHAEPAGTLKPTALRDALIARSRAATARLVPTSAAEVPSFRSTVIEGWRVLCDSDWPSAVSSRARELKPRAKLIPLLGQFEQQFDLSREEPTVGNAVDRVPATLRTPSGWNQRPGHHGRAVLLVTARPDQPRASGWEAELVRRGCLLLTVEPFQTGTNWPNGKAPAGPNADADPATEFFAGYNRTVLANRVHDLLTAAGWLAGQPGVREVRAVGLGRAGAWAAIAAAIAGERIRHTVADAADFVTELASVPGSGCLGGMPFVAAVLAERLTLMGAPPAFADEVRETVAALSATKLPPARPANWPVAEAADGLLRA